MEDEMKRMVLAFVLFGLIAFVLVSLGCFYDLYLLLVIGSLCICGLIYFFISWIATVNKHARKSNLGCVLSIVVITLCLLVFKLVSGDWRDERYITRSSWVLHKYKDCIEFDYSDDVEIVSKLEGFYHFVFTECDICNNREREEKQMRRLIEKQELEERLLEIEQEKREDLIEYFNDIISLLENGESVNYVESKIQEDFEIDQENYYEEDYY